MLALAFLNPLLLWAVPLCAVPIVIHLLNRRRFQRVPWAAMEYLLAALKRNRKRLRMEQWLVLLLRTLAVLLLALLVARPQLTGGALLGARTHHVVVLDDTASMSQRAGSVTLWDRAVDEVRQLADRLGETRGGDLLSIVRTGRSGRPDLWSQRVGPDLGRRVGALLKELPAGDGPMDLGTVLALVQERAREVQEAARTEYYLVTDLRAVDWLADDDRPRPALQAALAGLDPQTAHLSATAVGARDAENVGIVAVRREGRLTAVGVQLALAVDVQNHGLDASQPTELAVEMDGKSRTVRPVPHLAPGERITIPLAHTFFTAGDHRIEASLPAVDHYPLDDRRALALPVPERSKALLVDGEPGESAEGGETLFLQVALDQTSEVPTGIEPHVVTDAALAELDLSQFDVIYLCNVAAPAPAVVEKLERYVADGGGLVIHAGAQVDVGRYNELLHRGGQGLLPLPFAEIAGDPDRPDHLFLAQKDHPICGDLGEALDVFCRVLVLVKRHLPMVDDPRAGAAVMARIGDAEGAPAIVSKAFGSGGGQVVVFGFAADKHWSNWPDTPANLVVAQQTHRFVTRVQDLGGIDLVTRGAYRLALDPGLYKPDVVLRSLAQDGEELTVTAAAADPAAAAAEQKALQLEVDMAELRNLGVYQADVQQHGGTTEPRLFVRNVPLAESRLQRLAPADFARVYPGELHDRVSFRDAGAGLLEAGQGELWRALAAAMLLALLLESLLAWRFGRR